MLLLLAYLLPFLQLRVKLGFSDRTETRGMFNFPVLKPKLYLGTNFLKFFVLHRVNNGTGLPGKESLDRSREAGLPMVTQPWLPNPTR